MDVKSIIIACLYLSAGLTALLALGASRRLHAPGAKPYVGLMICATLYSIGYALELSNTTLEGIRSALRIEYLGISFLPAFWVLMAHTYTRYRKNIPRWFYFALFIIPVMTLVLHYTNEHHHLYYRSLGVNLSKPFPLAAIGKGVWYLVHILFSNVCVLAGNILFYLMMVRSIGPYRKQATVMFYASLSPWIGNIIYQAGLSPYGIDLNPFFLAASAPVFAVALFRYRMFDLAPIARDTVFEVMHDPVLILDNLNRLADFNTAAAAILPGLSSDKIGDPLEAVFRKYPAINSLTSGNGEDRREMEVHGAGGVLLFDVRLIPICDKKAEGSLIIFHDITHQKQLHAQLQELAIRDGLTSCYNHRHLMELLEEETKRAKRYGRAFSLVMVDLDDFKRVNDTYGHQAGDKVLQNTAAVFRSILRSSDILGRYGGEEFVVLLPETSPETALEIAERLRSGLEQSTVEHDGQSISITASFGVSGAERFGPEDSFDRLLQRADNALYQAKRNGRNRVESV